MNLFKELYLDIFSKHNDVANLAGYIVEEVVETFGKVLVGISVDGYPSILIKADKEDSLEEDLPPLNGIEAKLVWNVKFQQTSEISKLIINHCTPLFLI